MPELPEVETVARQLAARVTGRTITKTAVRDEKLTRDLGGPKALARRLTNRTISKIWRSGKHIVLHLDSPKAKANAPLFLWVHLRMTGRMFVFDKAPALVPHERARLTLDRGAVVFADMRRFGTWKLSSEADTYAPVGVEPLIPAFTASKLADLIASSRTALKPWLLRQDRIVGIGNIYASEMCFRASLSPERPANSLSADEIKRLHRACRYILRKAIDFGGTTFTNFQNAEGERGEFVAQLKVYDHEGDPCPRCRQPIIRFVQQGRSTYHCPSCQR